MNRLFKIPILLAAALLATPASANVSVPGIFSNGAVLQKGPKTPVWGWASPGESVTVTLGSVSASTTASQGGTWRVELALNNANATPQNLVIQGNNTLTISDVLVGEVWLCSGQSNMQWKLNDTTGATAEIAQSNNPLIRHFATGISTTTPAPLTNQSGSWSKASPTTSGEFTAVGYYFAKKIHTELGIPVGIINSSVGGTPIEGWTSIEAFEWNSATKAFRDAQVPNALTQANYAAAFNSWIAATNRTDNTTASPVPFTQSLITQSEWTSVNVATTAETPITGGSLPSNGAIWIRRSVALTANTDFPFELGIMGLDKVYWNGELVNGIDPMPVSSNTNIATYQGRGATRIITIPKTSVLANNTLAIRIYAPIEVPTIIMKTTPLLGTWLAKAEYSYPAVTPLMVPAPPVMHNDVNVPINHLCSRLFNAMIHPWAGYGMRGVNWYQGEANAFTSTTDFSPMENYGSGLMVLIQDWRRRWGQEDLFFNICQLANYGGKVTQPAFDPPLCKLREMQSMMSRSMPNTEMANLIDLGEVDIHPRNKKDVGDRLGINALSKAYGTNVPHKGPVYKSMTVEGSRIRIAFDHTDSGLVAAALPATYWIASGSNQSAPLVRNSPSSQLEGFAIRGNGAWVWANATIDGNTVLVESSSITNPTEVRYAWDNNPTCNLYNGAGFPAVSFRTSQPALPIIPKSIETTGTWVQGVTHPRQPGSNRAFVVMVHGEAANSMSATSVTYGGQPMTKVVERSHPSGAGQHIYAGAFVLNEAGIAAATSGSISVTWSNPSGVVSDTSSAFFTNVNQATPTAATASNGLSGTTISTSPLATSQGDLVLLGTTAQNNQAYTINNYFLRGFAETNTSFGDITTAVKYANGSAETPSVTLSAVSDQAIVGFVLRKKPSTTANAPAFTENPLLMAAAIQSVPYTGETLVSRATDADGDAITFSKDSGPLWLTVNSNGTLAGTPPVGSVGLNEFVVRVTDSAALFATATLRINVTSGSAANAPVFTENPIILAAATENVSYTGQTLAGRATDADGGTLTFSRDSGPSWLVVNSNGALSGTPPVGSVGLNEFVVRVTDSTALFATATLRINVAAGSTTNAPVFNANPIIVGAAMENVPYTGQTLAGRATDADGNTLTFSRDSGPLWLAVNSNGTLSGTPPTGSLGLNDFVVRVTDSTGLFATATLRIDVTARPSGPTNWVTSPVNQNWGNPLNWTLGVPDINTINPTDFGIGDCAPGQFPIIETGNFFFGAPTSNQFATSAVGSGSSTTGRLDIRSGSLSRDASNSLISSLGVATFGKGPVMNVANTAITAQSNLTTYGQGSGSLNVRTLFVGTFGGSSGTVNINTTGSVSALNFFFVGNQGIGVVNLTSGKVHTTIAANGMALGAEPLGVGTFNMEGGTLGDGASNKLGFVTIGRKGIGTFNQTGGSMNLEGTLRFGENAGSTGTANISGGSASVNDLQLGSAGTGILNISNTGSVTVRKIDDSTVIGINAGATGTVNLNGGSLTSRLVRGGLGTSRFNFNGGTLVATHTHTGFFQGLTEANILAGGAMVDTVANDVTIAQNLQGPGGLIKLGSGILTLSGMNTYAGGTTINGGKLALGASSTLPNATTLSIGAAELRPNNGVNYAIGTLDVTGTAVINLGTGSNTLAFANSSSIDWTAGSLNITGTFVSGSSIRFGTNNGGLTPAQVAVIRVNGTGTCALNAAGYLVLASASASSGFALWASENAAVPDDGPAADKDLDGVLNAIEYVIGGTEDTNDQYLLPKASAGGNEMVFTFIRDQISICPCTTVKIETSTNLTDWPNAYIVGADTAGSSEGVEIAKDQPAAGKDSVTLRIPVTPENKAYARLKVTITP